MAKEQVEFSMEVCVFLLQNVCSWCTLLCDIDNNWVLLLFTSCTLLTLSLDLIGGMGTSEADPSQI
jgi:hypothetical protein